MNTSDYNSPEFVFPVGTQIVTLIDLKNMGGGLTRPQGAVGVVIKSPPDNSQSYLVRFPDGIEEKLSRQQIAIRKHFEREGMQRAPVIADSFGPYRQYIIYRCLVGSRAYGLETDTSDRDWRGVYLPSADMHWSFFGIPEQLENPATDEVYWELQKFLSLALKANPNILECLYTPLVDQAKPVAQELLAIRSIFLSKRIYQTYNGYVISQFKRMQKSIENQGAIRWKHPMHLIRLLLSGITALNEGYIPVRVEEHRAELLAIKAGEVPWEEVNQWRLSLHRQFDEAYIDTALPNRPDYDRANQFLIAARRSAVAG